MRLCVPTKTNLTPRPRNCRGKKQKNRTARRVVPTKKKEMKNKILKLIGVAALALAAILMTSTAGAQVPTYGPATICTSPATLATTAGTNFANPPIIDCSRQQHVAVMFSFNQGGASTSNVVYTLYPSVDGIYYDANAALTITIPSTGTTRVNYSTNINCGGFGYYEIYSMANTTALTTCTNLGVVYGIKTLAP